VNVRILSAALILPLFVSGCALFSKEKPVEVKNVSVERVKLELDDPKPLTGRSVQWIVVTPENIEQIWKDLKNKNIDLVLFAITDDGYEQLSVTMAELRNYIAQQRSIILRYKEYYEPVQPVQKKN
jgi:hypothetical protein